jgi:hypothetical protein
MSLLERVKQSLKKIEENTKDVEDPKDSEDPEDPEDPKDPEDSEDPEDPENAVADEEHPDFEESFTFYKKKWVITPFMSDIRKGDLEKIPIECMFSHYILFSRELHCYYIGLHNHESGDEFEIYEFDWVGEDEDPEFKEITQTINARDCAKFLAQRISEGYFIYIPEREELEDLA